METIIKRIPVKGMPFKEIMDFHGFKGVIPNKFIINKRIPGLGCTTNELESERNSIIIAPFTAIIEVKEAGYGDKLFTVYGEYDIDDVATNLLSYLNNDEIPFKKIMTTPESFYKVKKALFIKDKNFNDNFFMLFDECDVLVSDAIFRPRMLEILPDFFSFKNHAFISATPIIPTDPRFAEHGFKQLKLEPDFKIDNELNLVITNNINSSARDIIDYCNKRDNNPIFIFTNCKRTIAYLARLSHIKDDYKIFCAENLKNDFFIEQGITQVYTSISDQSFAKFNFLTSRFFSGVDILLPDNIKPHIIMISNITQTAHSIIHPSITAVQIFGRCRAGVSSITHITTTYKGIPHSDEETIVRHIDKEIYHLNELRKIGSKVLTKQHRNFIKDMQEINQGNVVFNNDDTVNSYYRDNYLMSKLTENIYTSVDSIINEYKRGDFFNVNYSVVYKAYTYEDINKLKKATGRRKGIEVLTQIHSLVIHYGRFNISNEQDIYHNHLYLLQKEDPLIYEAYYTIGPTEVAILKYNRKAIRHAIYEYNKKESVNNLQMIDEIISSFRLNEVIYIDKIEAILNEIYLRFNYRDKYGKIVKPKGNDIELYFDNKRYNGKKKVNGVYRTYYILYKAKYKLSSDFKR